MILRQESRSRAQMGPVARRRSSCYRHPEGAIAGICASCLRERLNGLDVSITEAPELRRCSSVVSRSNCESSSVNSYEPRRKSCDVISSRRSLYELLGAENLRCGSESEPRIDWSNSGLAGDPYTVMESISGHGNGDGEDEEEKLRTMREFIDLESNQKTRKSMDLKEMAGNLIGAASFLSKKLLKWKMKKKPENSREGIEAPKESRNLKFFHYRKKLRESHSPIVGARKSCEYTGSMFPLEAGRISFEQPRASWDGYMIARTIPRLTPMFPMVDYGILDRLEKHRFSFEGPMHSIAEEKSSSRASGSSYSNSDSSSMQLSSFDRSTSVKSYGNKVMGNENCGASPANVKLVITEKELKDWNLSSGRDKNSEKVSSSIAATDSEGDPNSSVMKPVPWRRICKSLRFRVRTEKHFQEG